MKQTKKEKIKFKLSSFLFGLGLSTIVFSYLIFLVRETAVNYFPIANEQELTFANCVMGKIDIKNPIFTTCNHHVKQICGTEFFPSESIINQVKSESYSILFNFPIEFYNIADPIFGFGILFGLFFLIAGIIILRFKNY